MLVSTMLVNADSLVGADHQIPWKNEGIQRNTFKNLLSYFIILIIRDNATV